MIAPSALLGLVLLYAALLFAVAWLADRSGAFTGRLHPLIYALSLSVYCSSWTFYGAVGSAANQPWQHAAIYIGPILLYTFGWRLISRLLTIGSRQRVTSIADYISSRYDKRQSIAVLVTIASTATVIPYIALQLIAVSQCWRIITADHAGIDSSANGALFIATIMAIFTILFGTRRLRSDERHTGLMAAIATEAVVKLCAFAAVAGLAIAYLIQELSLTELSATLAPWRSLQASPDFFAQILLSLCAIVCLPRQFHVSVVEYQREPDGRYGRWMLPLYLIAFMLLAVPISMAGTQLFSGSAVAPDSFVQHLPIALNQQAIAIAALLGGISAATGMAIVATVSLAIMVTNELVVPLLVRRSDDPLRSMVRLGDRLRWIRQLSIALIFYLAWLAVEQLNHIPKLSDIGFLSFLAAAQLAPALLIGSFWPRANALGVVAGMSAGLGIWLYCALLPAILPQGHPLLLLGPFQQGWLLPTQLFFIEIPYPLAHATFWSLLINTGLFALLSLAVPASAREKRQMERFLSCVENSTPHREPDYSRSAIRVNQLQALLNTFLQHKAARQWQEFEELYQQRLLPGDRAPQFVVNRTESLLAMEIGSASANHIIKQLSSRQQLAIEDFVDIVSGATAQYQFTRELLQTTVETIRQGISVVDSSLKLVAWNDSYEKMFDYPPRLLYVGCDIEHVYRFNAERGLMGPVPEREAEIRKRLSWLSSGSPYRLERTLPNGTVIDICGNPMPHGGFVTTYLDVTEHQHTLLDLEEARNALQQRVETGGRELSETNAKLRRENQLRAQAEASLREAHDSKSRFMSATSHDLLQPLNAARLFTATLKARHQQFSDPTLISVVNNIDQSLNNAEILIAALREIARLDSGKQKPVRKHFEAATLINQLATEFQLTAEAKGLALHSHSSSCWLYSDPNLLNRILQNFLANAIRYTSSGRVVLGCRRYPDTLSVEVWDTGPGIPESEQQRIFTEFERLQQPGHTADEGLGLGLAIAERCAKLLGRPIELQSAPGRGTKFAIQVPYGCPPEAAQDQRQTAMEPDLSGCAVLCIDNDNTILHAMRQLLETWGCKVSTARNGEEALRRFQGHPPAIMLTDYHLGRDEIGVDLIAALNRQRPQPVPTIIISADDSDATREHVKSAGFHFIAKPVNPGRLKATMRQLTHPAR